MLLASDNIGDTDTSIGVLWFWSFSIEAVYTSNTLKFVKSNASEINALHNVAQIVMRSIPEREKPHNGNCTQCRMTHKRKSHSLSGPMTFQSSVKVFRPTLTPYDVLLLF